MINKANEIVDIKDVFNINKISEESKNVIMPPEVVETEQPEKRKRGRPRKNQTNNTDTPTNSTTVFVPLCQSNDPYEDSYAETNHMLRESIGQINMLSNDVQSEIENIRKSKTLKGKYKYISDLCATASTLVSTKISAIREMNASTTNCHKLEIQRLKDVKATQQQNQQDDDKYMADLYNAYINTPINSGSNPLLAMNAANTINNQAIITGGTPVMGNLNEEQEYQNFLQNMTPEQNRMLLDGNPNIETVVVYDPATGAKSFDVIDITTGIPVDNYPRPDNIFLDDTTIDFASGIASNTNIGQNWKVVTLPNSGDNAINNY